MGQLPSGSCCAHSVNSFFPEGLEGAHLRKISPLNNAIAELSTFVILTPGVWIIFLKKSLKAGTLALPCGQGIRACVHGCLFVPRDVHTLQYVLGVRLSWHSVTVLTFCFCVRYKHARFCAYFVVCFLPVNVKLSSVDACVYVLIV